MSTTKQKALSAFVCGENFHSAKLLGCHPLRDGYVFLHERTGWKFGRWHDTVWMHRRTYDGAPRTLVPVHALDAQEVQRLIRETEKKLSEKLKM